MVILGSNILGLALTINDKVNGLFWDYPLNTWEDCVPPLAQVCRLRTAEIMAPKHAKGWDEFLFYNLSSE